MPAEFQQYHIGDLINKMYRVLDVKPPGGMGVVVIVDRMSDGRRLALKYCRYDDDHYIQRFIRESRISRRIEHANVIDLITYNEKHRPPYFTMEVARGSLEDELGSLSCNRAEAMSAITELCVGLQAIHDAGAVHRDVKPANALRMSDGTIRLADFGLARLEDRDTVTLTQTQMRLGTVDYAAPEQLEEGGSKNADARTDIFQLGKTIYHIITGKTPLLIDPSRLPSGIAHIVRRCTKPNPEERYQSVLEVLDAIEMFTRAEEPSARPAVSFEAVLELIGERTARGRINESDISKLLAILESIDGSEDELFKSLFDKVPTDVLAVGASLLESQFEPVLRRFVRIASERIGYESFSYADYVARDMQAVLKATPSDDIASLAIQATLVAAFGLNRFAAMAVLDAMLISVQDDGRAMVVAEMLKREMRRYSAVAERVSPGRLHPAIAAVRLTAARR